MGMYDSLYCDYPLPLGHKPLPKGITFQTKELDKLLEWYRITREGRLVKELCLAPEASPYEGKDLVEPEGGPVDVDYNGWFRFYERQSHHWWKFKARFADGQIAEAALVEEHSHDGETGDTTLYWLDGKPVTGPLSAAPESEA